MTTCPAEAPGGTARRAGIEVRDLRVGFRSRSGEVLALDDVSLSVPAGELLAVVGPSGCGKSTLLRALADLMPASGAAVSGALAVPRDPVGRPDVAWMPQQDCLLPWRRVLANAVLGARVAGVGHDEARRRARALLADFGLAGFERAWPHELSGGMRQRLALLRTALAGRSVLLLDEPFGALDAITRRGMNTWLAELRRTHDGALPSTAVLVTHDVEEAVTLADRIVVMSARPGRVVEELRVDATASPRDRVVAALERSAATRPEVVGASA